MARHILTIPYVYSVTGVQPRKRNSVSIDFLGRVPVIVEDAPADAHPVVVEATLPDGRAMSYRKGADGGLLRPVWLPERPGCPPGFLPSQDAERRLIAFAVSLTDGGHGNPYPLLSGSGGRVSVTRQAGDEDDREVFREVFASSRKEAEDRVREAYRRAAFVDGVLHVPSEGPAWMFEKREQRQGRVLETGIRLVEEFADVQRYSVGREAFAWDQPVAALARLEDAVRSSSFVQPWERKGFPSVAVSREPAGSVRRPDAETDELAAGRGLVARIAGDAADAARWALEAIRPDLASLDPASIRAYADVKEKVGGKDGVPLKADHDVIRSVVRPLLKMHTAWRASRPEGGPTPVDALVETIEAARDALPDVGTQPLGMRR